MKQVAHLLAAALAPVLLTAQNLTLAKRGQPAAYTLVRSTNASPSQIYAAEEFQRFTEQMTGVKLPLITDDAPLPAQAPRQRRRPQGRGQKDRRTRLKQSSARAIVAGDLV